jgi:hypothetical protein
LWILEVAGKAQCNPYIGGLCSFVPARQENDQLAAVPFEVDPVAWTVVDAHFGNSFANGFGIARIPCNQAFDPDLDSRPRSNVTKTIQPIGEYVGLENAKHGIV